MNTWKKTALGLIACAAIAGSASRASAVCGDLNGNGSLTIADCVQLFDVVAGPPDPAGLCGGAGAAACGDLNADGSVNIADGIICLSAVSGTETLFPLCSGAPAPVACPGGTKTINANITNNQTWPNTCTILLDGTIFVSPNVVVTIQPGTVIKGKKVSSDGSPSALVFQRDAKINAVGTQSQPIVFTSDQAPGTRTKGDWGGLVLNGRSIVNVPGGEGLAEGLSSVPFGGGDPNDSSGVVRFVRIEFAGRALTVDNELNLFTMNGVGAGTTVDHVQTNVGLDDCFEWFGGTVNSKYVVATGCGDDGLDWQLGTTGAAQFALVAQNVGVVESGGMGFEGDNNENGFDLLPRSNPKFCNVTLIGTKGQAGSPAGANQVGGLLRRGTAGVVAKAIFTAFHKAGFELDHATPGCSAGPALTGQLLVRDSLFFNNGGSGSVHFASGSGGNAPSPCTGGEFYDLLANSYNNVPDLCGAGPLGCTDQAPVADPGVSAAYPPADPRPANAAAVANAFDCSTVDGFFQPTSYLGAFDPAGSNWLVAPWVDFSVN